jgi:hypothetical protein
MVDTTSTRCSDTLFEYAEETVDKPVFKFLVFRPVITPMRSFEKWREVSSAGLFSVGIVIFVF